MKFLSLSTVSCMLLAGLAQAQQSEQSDDATARALGALAEDSQAEAQAQDRAFEQEQRTQQKLADETAAQTHSEAQQQRGAAEMQGAADMMGGVVGAGSIPEPGGGQLEEGHTTTESRSEAGDEYQRADSEMQEMQRR